MNTNCFSKSISNFDKLIENFLLTLRTPAEFFEVLHSLLGLTGFVRFEQVCSEFEEIKTQFGLQ